MNQKIELHSPTPEDIRNELRRSILPELLTNLGTIAEELINNIQPPVDLITGKTLNEAQTALEMFRHNNSIEIHTLLKQELTYMIANTEKPPQVETIEILDKPTPINVANDAVKPKRSKPMPLSTMRQIIKDRVSDETIESVLKHHKAGKSPKEIRATGIGLEEPIIQTIINDNPILRETQPKKGKGSPKLARNKATKTAKSDKEKQEAADAFTKREIKRLYKQGFTTDYIANSIEKPEEEVEALIPEMTEADTELSPLTIELLKTLKPEEAAEKCNLRPEVLAHHMNGAQP